MKRLLLCSLFWLAGCAEYQAVIAERGGQAADSALQAVQFGHCQAATAAALEREYQLYSNPNGPKAMAWRELCWGSDEAVEADK